LKKLISLVILISVAVVLVAQTASTTAAPKPEDVSSIENILKAFYESTSGPKGPRDWDRFYSLFSSDARMSGPGQPPISPQEVQKQIAPILETHSFFLKEISTKVEKSESGAQVIRTYEFTQQEGGALEGKGVDTFKLRFDGKRWWIDNVEGRAESSTTVSN
jgi:hypothetical protein